MRLIIINIINTIDVLYKYVYISFLFLFYFIFYQNSSQLYPPSPNSSKPHIKIK